MNSLHLTLSQTLACAIHSLSSAITCLIVAFYFSWSLTLVILCTVPLVVFILARLSTKMDPNIRNYTVKMAEAIKYILAALNGIEVVKCMNAEEIELWKFLHRLKAAGNFYKSQAALGALQVAFMQFAVLGMFVQGFWYGGSLIRNGKKDAGDVMTTFWAALMATQSFVQMAPHLMALEKGIVAAERLRRVCQENQDTEKKVHAGAKLDRCSGEVEFRNVCLCVSLQLNSYVLIAMIGLLFVSNPP
jgi:ATP-binding cassette, subfamily B (MDR/TAP), member 1